jgi:cation:H+ antiporter
MMGFILLISGLVMVIKGAGWLVDGSSNLARRLGVSDLAIGLTVVAFGTSLPELTVNIFAAIGNEPAVAIGNVTGSNICNILLILGIAALLRPIQVQQSTVWKEIPFCLLAQIMLWVMVMDKSLNGATDNILSRTEGFGLIAMFLIFLAYIAGMAKKTSSTEQKNEQILFGFRKSVVLISLGLVLLVIGGKGIVEGAIRIADWMGLGKSFIAVTLIAVGTSIPELATSIVAAYKKNADIAVGNVVGSNIFNILFVLGTTSIIHPIPMSEDLMLSIYVGIIAIVVLFITLFTGKRHTIDRWEGAGMLGLYVLYLMMQPR